MRTRGVSTRFGPVPAIAMLLVLPMLSAGGVGAEEPPDAPSIGPEVALQLDPSTGVTRVSDTEYGTVLFRGTAQMDKPPIDQVVVTLSASVDTGWSAGCSPVILFFTSSIYETFTVTVTVPPGTLASAVGILTVEGKATGRGFTTTSSTSANVTVEPYYRLRLQCGTTYKDISPGGEASFKVEVLNLGNDNDTYIVSIGNESRLRDAGWSFEVVLPSIPFVPPGASMPFYVHIQAPWKPSDGQSECGIDVKVTSRKSVARDPIQSGDVLLTAKLKGGLDNPLDMTIIVAVVAIAAAAAALVWRRKRKGRATDVREAPPT